jgi:XisI protein
MDSLSQYREIIKQILTEHGNLKPVYGEIEMQLVFDEARDHYQVLRAGWLKKSRVYGVLIHIDIKGDQLWIQYDGTEVGVANELAEAGIPRKDIILAYQPPLIRAHSGFGV